MIQGCEYLRAYVCELIVSGDFLCFDDNELAVDLDVTIQDFEDNELDDWISLHGCEPSIELQKRINTHHDLRIFDESELLQISTVILGRRADNGEKRQSIEKSKCAVCQNRTIVEAWDFCLVCGWQDGTIGQDGRSASNRDASGAPMFIGDAHENWVKHLNIRGTDKDGCDSRTRLFWKSILENRLNDPAVPRHNRYRSER